PPGEVPESGFPVVYAADGNTQFLTMAETVSNAARRPEVASGAIVVGIGYPDGIDAVEERGFDLTPTPGPDDSPVRGGGADVLLEFIRSELQPEIARRHDVDASRRAWFGHSFGGLFGLYVYTRRNDTFDEYFLASPSIWWDDRAILGDVCRFANAPEPGAANVHFTVGQYEQEAAHWIRDKDEAARTQKMLNARGQISNAREVAAFLAGTPGLGVSFDLIPGEDHGSVVPASISRAAHVFLRDDPVNGAAAGVARPEWCPAHEAH
ncbi:MAG: hypothetical protein MJA32_02635, partial [Proteobacteria bacterium]|nr:hypothetical protein [Pseudomonadota bacterium]